MVGGPPAGRGRDRGGPSRQPEQQGGFSSRKMETLQRQLMEMEQQVCMSACERASCRLLFWSLCLVLIHSGLLSTDMYCPDDSFYT